MIEARIVAELSQLSGLPLTRVGRAAGVLMLTFGLLRPAASERGRGVKVGDFCLHIQCSWRIVQDGRIVVAAEDMFYPADDEMEWDDFDPETMDSRLQSRMEAWRKGYLGYPVCAKEIQADGYGGFDLPFECGSHLQVFPDNSLTGENAEFWRIFKPNEDDSHFVVRGGGRFGT